MMSMLLIIINSKSETIMTVVTGYYSNGNN